MSTSKKSGLSGLRPPACEIGSPGSDSRRFVQPSPSLSGELPSGLLLGSWSQTTADEAAGFVQAPAPVRLIVSPSTPAGAFGVIPATTHAWSQTEFAGLEAIDTVSPTVRQFVSVCHLAWYAEPL